MVIRNTKEGTKVFPVYYVAADDNPEIEQLIKNILNVAMSGYADQCLYRSQRTYSGRRDVFRVSWSVLQIVRRDENGDVCPGVLVFQQMEENGMLFDLDSPDEAAARRKTPRGKRSRTGIDPLSGKRRYHKKPTKDD